MMIVHPNSDQYRQQRNSLLQLRLRNESSTYPIEQEYPLVLSRNFSDRSYCWVEDSKVAAHVNLWKRTALLTPSIGNNEHQQKIGLIGNVATAESLSGRGIMSRFLDHMKQLAYEQRLTALILWSDLLSFYQKCGFVPFGKEFRLSLDCKSMKKCTKDLKVKSSWENPRLIDELTAKKLISLRAEVPTLERSPLEFINLLHIPDIAMIIAHSENGETLGYSLIGKGSDMAGVVHEWGAQNPQVLFSMMRFLAKKVTWDSILVLSPTCLPETWWQIFGDMNAILQIEDHHMALSWQNEQIQPIQRSKLDTLFIWGLDSI